MKSIVDKTFVRHTFADHHPTMTSLIPASFRPFRLALIQLATTTDKQANLRRARLLVKEARSKGANVVVLPVNVCKSKIC